MKKTTKIITLILSALLLIGCAIGISVSAEENAPTVTIKYKNLSYEGAVKVLYAVEATNVPEGAKVQMAFFENMPASVTDTPAYVKDAHSEDITIGDASYKAFFSNGVAPKNMRKNIYAVPVITLDGEIIASGDPVEYSIYTYAINMFSRTPTVEQKALYTALLDYGASVQELLLGTPDYTEADLLAAGGYANAYCGLQVNTVLDRVITEVGAVNYYRPGEVATLTADVNYNGALFTGFADAVTLDLIGSFNTEVPFAQDAVGIKVINKNYYTAKTETYDNTTVATGYGATNYLVGVASANSIVNVNPEGDPNYALLHTHASGAGTGSISFAYFQDGGEAYIFETDVMFTGTDATAILDNWLMRWGFVSSGTNGKADAAGYAYCNYFCSTTGDDGHFTGGTAGYNALNDAKTESAPYYKNAALTVNEWHRVRFELIPKGMLDGKYVITQNVYIDGNLAYSVSLGSTVNLHDIYTFNIAARASSAAGAWQMYLDNTVAYTVVSDYYGKGLYANDSDVNTYDGTKTNYTAGTIVTEYNGNNVLQFSKTTSGSSIVIKTDSIEYGETYVFETDIKWIDTPASQWGRPWLGRIGFQSDATKNNSEDNAHMGVRYAAGTTAFGGMSLASSSASGSTTDVSLLKSPDIIPGTWYNLRFEYTPTGINADGLPTGHQVIYLNGVEITSYDTVEKLKAGGVKDNTNLYGFKFAFLAKTGFTVQFDNTYIGAIGKANVNNFENGTVNQTFMTFSNTETDCVESYTVVDNPVATDTKSATDKVLKAVVLKTGSEKTSSDQSVNSIKLNANTTAQARGVYEFSYDMLYEGAIPSNGQFTQFVVQVTSGYAALFSLNHKGNGIVEITSDVDGKDPGKGGAFGRVTLLDGHWHNLRFVMYKDGRDSVYALYVDGELVGINNYYHNIASCVTNQRPITVISHRVQRLVSSDESVTSANYYFDNMNLYYLGDIPEIIPDWTN